MDIRPLASAVQSPPASPSAPDPSVPAVATVTTSPPSAQPVAPAQPEPSLTQVNQAVQKINSAMELQAQGIEFSVDSSSHRIIVNIVDQQTNQVIRQIPSKEALAISDALDQTQGLLIKQQA